MATTSTPPRPARPARHPAVGALLALAVGAGGLLVTVSYGFATEYADTSASAAETFRGALGDWGIVMLVPAAFAGGAVAVAGGSRLVRTATVTAVALMALVVVGVGTAAVLGAEAKFDRYPATPDCVGEFTSGPGHAGAQRAQRVFEDLDHPAPFSGGGSSGVAGCSSQLMVRDERDPRPTYHEQLAAKGWAVVDARPGALRMEGEVQALEVAPGEGGTWTVWIGPRGLNERELDDGQVAPMSD